MQIITRGRRGEVRITKNNGLYVIFPKIGKSIQVCGSIRNPKMVTLTKDGTN
jgi:hypothetical protein